jgi:hypothetical protein
MIQCLVLSAAATAAGGADNPPRLIAEVYDSGFAFAHDTYNGMGTGSDGRIYYVLCAEPYDVAGQMYRFDPPTRQIKHLGDLTEACGEKAMKAVAQGKSHVNFVECQGRLYFATHIGYYAKVDGREVKGPPPPGWKPYQGGHFLAYHMAAGKFEDLGIPLAGEGVIAMNMDVKRGRLYGLTWPTGHFVSCDLVKKEMRDLGATALDGEKVRGARYRTICRSLSVDPQNGAVYLTTGDGAILRYDYDRQTIEIVPDENMRKDYFGLYDPTFSGHMGYNWRQVVWYAPEEVFYGIHGNSGYLFRFDPRAAHLDVLERITSLPSQRSGMYDQFSYGYLGFTLGPNGRTLYYLTGGPIYVHGKRLVGRKITHTGEADIPTAKYIDHGAIFTEDGQRLLYVNSIAVGKEGTVYTLARVSKNGHTRTDLIRIPAKSIAGVDN